MSIWRVYARTKIIDDFLNKKENPYYWGAINIENCKSANNKNCLMAIYRASKNKKHFTQILKHRKYMLTHKLFN